MKKVLIVSYYSPPLGTGGVNRAFKFAKYLPQFGWEPYVLTVKKVAYFQYDYEKEREFSRIKHLRTESLDVARLSYLLFRRNGRKTADLGTTPAIARLARLFTLIDPKSPWIPFAYSAGLRLIRRENIQLIFATSPPLSSNVVGMLLAKRTGLAYVADFRDPFLDVYPPPTFLHRTVLETAFRKIKKRADAVTAVTPAVVNALGLEGAHVIENGYDPDDLPVISREKHEKKGFLLAYAGSLLGREFSLLPLLEAVREMDDVSLLIVGKIGEGYLRFIEDPRLSGKVEFREYLPHREALRLIAKADALWVTQEKKWTRNAVPSKLFEYIGLGKPILATVEGESEIANYISRFRLGITVSPEKEAIKRALIELKNGEHKLDPSVIEYFSRQKQTERLASIFEEVLSSQASRS